MDLQQKVKKKNMDLFYFGLVFEVWILAIFISICFRVEVLWDWIASCFVVILGCLMISF
jgi:hypothetical protein